MKKTLRPLLTLLLSLSILMPATAPVWAASRGMNWWFFGGKIGRGHNRNGIPFSGNSGFRNSDGQGPENDSESANTDSMPFSDVPAWAGQQVAQMYRMGIIKGIGNGLFGSNQTLTREQFAVLLDREFGLSVSQGSATATFADVPLRSYYYPYIEAAASDLDYWNGPNGTYLFHPTDPITREDVIASMVQATGLANQTPDTSVLAKFTDSGSISPNLTNLVAISVTKGLVTGSQDQSGTWYLYPQKPLTRAEAAMLLYRALSYSVVAPGGITVPTASSDTMQLVAASSTGTINQPVEITATVLNSSGQAVNDVPVTFSVNGAATLGSTTVNTNSSGLAQTTLSDATAQTVTVTASAAGVSASTTVQFNATTTTVGSIQLNYSPQTALAGQPETLSATVLNSSGQAMNDVPVTFSANGAATLGSTTVNTNSSGIAQTTLSDATAQYVTVTASAAGVSASTTVQFNATTATVGSIQLNYSPQTALSGQPETLSATVLNPSGQAVNDVPVTFSVNGAATLGSTTVNTDSSGLAQTTLSDATAQTVTVTATAQGVSASSTVTFNTAVASIQLSYIPVPASVNQPVTVTATVYNSSGQELSGVPVTFGVNGAATIGSGPVYTNSAGVAQTTLNDGTAQTVTVTADSPGFNASATIQFNAG